MITLKNPAFELPGIEFVGGSTETLRWYLWHLSPTELENKDEPYNARGCQVIFSLVGYSTKYSVPDVCRNCEILEDENGIPCIASITLDPEETKNLQGKFLYQLTIRDTVQDIEISRQGIMYIWRNLNTALFPTEQISYLRGN